MNKIIAKLQSLIRYLETRQTVSSITAHLMHTVGELEAHADKQFDTAQSKYDAAMQALKEREHHFEEHLLATKIADNIKALLS